MRSGVKRQKTYKSGNAIYIYIVTAFVVLVGLFLFLQNFSVYADNSSVDVVELNVSASCTIGAVVNTAHDATLINGELKQDIGQTTIKAYCNDSGGYAIYAIGASGDADGQTDLINSFDSNYNIHTGLASSGATSAWAMKLTAGTVTDATDGISSTPPTIATGYDDYHAVPSTYTAVAYRTSMTEMEPDVTKTGSFITTTYRVYTSGAQPAGTYIGKVKYAMLHPYTNATVKSIKTALDSASGTETMVKDGVTYYTMQSMTHAICNQVNIIGEASQIQMIDKRDGSLYWVTKLEDGHCWMTQNLDLNLETTPNSVAALNSTNTDLNTYGSNGYDSSNGYTCSNASTTTNCTANGETITWAPERATIATGNLSSTTWTNDNDNPYSYNPGITVADGSNAYNGHKYAGNYYNWSAAIASNNSSSFASSTMGNVANNPQNSICPKGWRLPTIANNTTFPGTVAGSPNEFRRLNVLYNANVTDNATNLMNAPLYFARSGYVNGGSLADSGSGAGYWSSTVYSSTIAYYLAFGASYIYPENNYRTRYHGFSVRCIAR